MSPELQTEIAVLAPRAAERCAGLAFEQGLAITHPDGRRAPLATVLSPEVLGSEESSRRGALAREVASAVAKVARGLLRSERREEVLGALGPLEREIVQATFEQLDSVPLARVDCFVDSGGTPAVLEVNATIPALPGYSDIAAASFIQAVGEMRGKTARAIAHLIAANGSNALALLRALRAACTRRGQFRRDLAIALCARRSDPQLTELEFLARTFRDAGCPSEVVFPDEVELRGGELLARGRRPDVLFRHLFASRVDPASPLAEILRQPGRFAVFNPVDPQLELKAVLAELSAASEHPAVAASYGLTEAELQAARTVAWTRPLRHGSTIGPEGEPIADLAAQVAAEPERFVLKRSWAYGGHAVFLGSQQGDASQRARIEAEFGEPLDWPRLVEAALNDARGGGFVVQALAEGERRLLRYRDLRGEVKEGLAHVDYSAFTSIGLDEPGWGGVVRASFTGSVVNLVAGGTVVPVIREEVARELLG